MTDHAFGSDEAARLDFSVTAYDGVASHDRGAADYRLPMHEGACADMNRANYNRALFNIPLNVL